MIEQIKTPAVSVPGGPVWMDIQRSALLLFPEVRSCREDASGETGSVENSIYESHTEWKTASGTGDEARVARTSDIASDVSGST